MAVEPPLSPVPSAVRRRRSTARRLAAVALAASCTALLPLLHQGAQAGTTPGSPAALTTDQAPNDVAAGDDGAATPPGYWLVGSGGGLFSFRAAPFYASPGELRANPS